VRTGQDRNVVFLRFLTDFFATIVAKRTCPSLFFRMVYFPHAMFGT
jgi:hypothetical protein